MPFKLQEPHVDLCEGLRPRIHAAAHAVVREATGNKAHEHDPFELIPPLKGSGSVGFSAHGLTFSGY
jgi:hypothetical protein